MAETKYKKENHCPKCGSEYLDEQWENYFPDYELGLMYYHITCEDCGWEGEKWYKIKFLKYSEADIDPEDMAKEI